MMKRMQICIEYRGVGIDYDVRINLNNVKNCTESICELEEAVEECINDRVEPNATYQEFYDVVKRVADKFNMDFIIDDELRMTWQGYDNIEDIEHNEFEEACLKNGGKVPLNFKSTFEKLEEENEEYINSFGAEARPGKYWEDNVRYGEV